jgi:integrase
LRRRGKPKLYHILAPDLYRLQECEEASLFDRCIDYEKFTSIALELFNEVIELRQRSSLKTFRLWSSYLALAILILVNGLRIREALRAAVKFYEYGDRRFSIKAEKGGDNRNVIIPNFIEREDLEHLYKELIKHGEDKVMARVEMWLKSMFKVNTHSLRYAFIRYHTITGKSPKEIARALGLKHRRVIKEYYLRGLPITIEGEGEGYG